MQKGSAKVAGHTASEVLPGLFPPEKASLSFAYTNVEVELVNQMQKEQVAALCTSAERHSKKVLAQSSYAATSSGRLPCTTSKQSRNYYR